MEKISVVVDINNIKADLNEARRSRDTVRANILRVVVSEFELEVSRGNKPNLVKIIQKLIQSNEESLRYRPNELLINENTILSKYLPTFLTEKEVYTHLPNIELKGDMGKDMRACIEYFKSKGLDVDPKLINKVLTDKSAY